MGILAPPAEGDGGPASDVNGLRARVLAHAREKAELPPGLFTLTVPTGGGKTLTSLSFAFDHALAHKLRRIIYVIPFAGARIEIPPAHGRPIGEADAPSMAPHRPI